jgi:phosphatidylserine/phosphatidylglycerophosphate/cardiolipin synthase-like enzyme
MGKITSARAWANNEVAYIAWNIDGKIDGCLGFEVTRIYLQADGSVSLRPDGTEDRVKCAAWVPFKKQRNPAWRAQDTGVWPVQKLSWRDLTLRKRRDGMKRRPEQVRVRYAIRPVGDLVPGTVPVPSNGLEIVEVTKKDSSGKPVKESVRAYEGEPRPLGYLAPAKITNDILVTSRLQSFRSTFTNGILSAQWLRNVLNADGVIEKNELLEKIENPKDPHRKYLAGDVIPLIAELFERPGTFHLALYELEDAELEGILLKRAKDIHLILANTGPDSKGNWDNRNSAARARLAAAGVDVQHRMFNNSIHIGHNKFVVHVDPQGSPAAVLTGSTNWTSTGVAGQTNNALLVEDAGVAKAFLEYWKRLHADQLPLPRPLGKGMKDNQQGSALRQSNAAPTVLILANGARIETWFSPNRPERQKPKTTKKPAPVPPDLAEVYRRIRMAKEAILFLAFYPGQGGEDCIVGEAIDIGRKDRSLLVTGAVSTVQAMPNYRPQKKDAKGRVIDKGESPTVFDDGNVTVVRAARIDDETLLGDFGIEPRNALGAVGAIIHDKVVVIDPRLDECVVVLGSHNLGFKASYSNDENLLVVTGDRRLAEAYAVHILDVYDHYRFRAVETERAQTGKERWSGFLDTDDRWLDPYVTGVKGALSRYFAC